MSQYYYQNKRPYNNIMEDTRVNTNYEGEVGDSIKELPPIDFKNDHFPYAIVWTPIPMLTWFFPFIGHMGICMSSGVIRDFSGPYYVSEDNMGFGRPTRYLRLHPKNVDGGVVTWDEAVK